MSHFTFSFLEQQVKRSKKTLILTHIDPDGDALGAAMAAKYLFAKAGARAELCLAGKTTSGLRVTEKTLSPKEVIPADFDTIVVVDTNNLNRTGVAFPDEMSTGHSVNHPQIFIIDHHIKKNIEDYPANFHVLIQPEATASCEIIFDLLRKEGREISNVVAFCLLLGIYTDSGGFFHSNTTPALLRKAKELLQRGVFFKNITQGAFQGKNVKVLNFWGKKIRSATYRSDLKFIFNWFNQGELEKKGIAIEEIGGLVNLLNMCEEANFSLLLGEDGDGKIKGSLRSSEKKDFNVNILSRFLGGGGHRLAAGFEVAGKIVDKGKNIYVK